MTRTNGLVFFSLCAMASLCLGRTAVASEQEPSVSEEPSGSLDVKFVLAQMQAHKARIKNYSVKGKATLIRTDVLEPDKERQNFTEETEFEFIKSGRLYAYRENGSDAGSRSFHFAFDGETIRWVNKKRLKGAIFGADFDDDGGLPSRWGKHRRVSGRTVDGGDQVFWPVEKLQH